MFKKKYKLKIFLFLTLSLFLVTCFSNVSLAAYSSKYSEPTVLLKNGSRGANVKWLQDMLNHYGYNLSVDGIFGNNTYKAVVNFQKNHGLDVDGIVGKKTRSALKNESSDSSTTVNAYRYVTTGVHFRNGPGTSYISKKILSKNTKVYVYQIRKDGWTYVKYDNSYGYIYSKYLSQNQTTTAKSNSLPTFLRKNSSVINIAKACKKYIAENNFIYSLASGARTIPMDKSKLYNGNYCVDCSSYVSWILYEYALINGKTNMQNYFSYQRNSATFASIGAAGRNSYLSVVDKKDGQNINLALAKPGDILVSKGHVEIFDSYTKNGNTLNIKVYNCGSTSSARIAGITTSATKNINDITYILRAK